MSSAPDDSQVLDLDHLRRQTAEDGGLERELIGLFEAQCARLRPVIRDGGPCLGRADAAHTLKGSARAIGAWRLASLADRLETALRGEEAGPDLTAMVAQLEEAVEATRAALSERLRASAA